jgi:hypothetical protein
MKIVMQAETLFIFPNRGGRITLREGSSEAIVEGGIPYQHALNALQQMVSLGVLIQGPEVMSINRNSIFLKDRESEWL